MILFKLPGQRFEIFLAATLWAAYVLVAGQVLRFADAVTADPVHDYAVAKMLCVFDRCAAA